MGEEQEKFELASAMTLLWLAANVGVHGETGELLVLAQAPSAHNSFTFTTSLMPNRKFVATITPA